MQNTEIEEGLNQLEQRFIKKFEWFFVQNYLHLTETIISKVATNSFASLNTST